MMSAHVRGDARRMICTDVCVCAHTHRSGTRRVSSSCSITRRFCTQNSSSMPHMPYHASCLSVAMGDEWARLRRLVPWTQMSDMYALLMLNRTREKTAGVWGWGEASNLGGFSGNAISLLVRMRLYIYERGCVSSTSVHLLTWCSHSAGMLMRVGAGGGGGERVKREVCALVEKLVQSQEEVGLSELSSGLSQARAGV